MNRLEQIDGIHAVVFEAYRGRVPLLERKVGNPINPAGTDLWVLCPDENDAQRILRYGERGINEYVTAQRRHTYEQAIASVPASGVIVFSKASGDDDAIMRTRHPEVVSAGQRFAWRNGTYYLAAETDDLGQYATRESRVGKAELSPTEFRDAVRKVSNRLAARAPVVFHDASGDTIVSAAAGRLLEALTSPGAAALRYWLDQDGQGKEGKSLTLSCAAFVPELAEGIASITFEHGHPRIRTRILYTDGSVLNDLGLRLARPLPSTVMHGAIGTTIDRLVDAVALGPWEVHQVDAQNDSAYFGLRIPNAPIGRPAGHDPLSETQARALLANVLERDMRTVPAVTSMIKELDRNGARDPDVPCLLTGCLDALGTLSALGPEVGAYVLEELLVTDHNRSVDLGAWLGSGSLERNIDQITVRNAAPVALANTSLMPRNIMP